MIGLRDALCKVTVIPFVMETDHERVVVLGHPDGGLQLIGGTVEAGETAVAAAIRECQEEAGLVLCSPDVVQSCRQALPYGQFVLLEDADRASEHVLRRGHTVTLIGSEKTKSLVEEVEYDLSVQPPTPLRRHRGYVQQSLLSDSIERTFVVGTVLNPRDGATRVADGRQFVVRVVSARQPPGDFLVAHSSWLQSVLEQIDGRF